jgi:hypothetical protein
MGHAAVDDETDGLILHDTAPQMDARRHVPRPARLCGIGQRCDHLWTDDRIRRHLMLWLILLLVLLFGGGGGYYGYSRWGTGGGLGIVGTVIVIVLILYFVGGMR